MPDRHDLSDRMVASLKDVDATDTWPEAARRASNGSPSRVPAEAPVRQRIVAAVAAIVIFLGAGAVAVAAFTGSSRAPAAPSPTLVPSGGTYRLSHFDVKFPAEPRGVQEEQIAAITLDTAWSGATYPGEATCTFQVLEAGGDVIASQTSSFAALKPSAHVTVTVPVPQGTPADATGECSRGMLFEGSSYVFEDVHVVRDEIVADVTWSAGTPVGIAACAVQIITPDGEVSVHTGTLGIGEGEDHAVMNAGRAYDQATASIRCEPYRTPDQNLPSYWRPWRVAGDAVGTGS